MMLPESEARSLDAEHEIEDDEQRPHPTRPPHKDKPIKTVLLIKLEEASVTPYRFPR